MKIFQILTLLCISVQINFSQNLIINEVLTSNQNGLVDEYGDTPDWIEVFNSSANLLDLSKYYLSDRKDNLKKWNFPSFYLKPNEYLLVLASGKVVSQNSISWSTIVTRGESWNYFIGNSEPSNQWKDINFNDSDWDVGNSGIGYGDGDDETIIPVSSSIYLRKSFIIEDLSAISDAFLSIDFDDGFVAYLNGEEIARDNLGSVGEFVPFNSYSDEPLEARLYRGEKLNAFYISEIASKFVQGQNVISLQVHNANANSSDLTAIPFLTLGFNSHQSENSVAEEVEHLIPNIHTNFSLSNGNESLYLSNIDGEIIDSVERISLPNDISYGRDPNNTNSWLLFDTPTPGLENETSGYFDQLELPKINFEAGYYNSSINIELINNQSYSTYYTMDGSEPTESSLKIENAITIQNTTVLKLKTFGPGRLPSKTNTYTYLIDDETTLPIVSLSTNPTNLWDFNNGIYVKGPNAESNFPFFNANFWQDWERDATFEFIDKYGQRQIHSDVRIKIFGGWSRAYEQRSISVFAEKGVGDDNFNYRIFSRSKNDNFRSLVLRNSGNDWNSTMMRDAFMQSLAENLDVDRLQYEPSILFLNGEYWGIHNVREKINLSYINALNGVDKDSIDLLELNGEVIDGDNSEYYELIDYLNSNSLSINTNYEFVKSKINIKNFIDYYCLQIFIANTDWPGNNNKFWKKSGENEKWRWILFDTDFGFGWINTDNYNHNTLSFASSSNGPAWPNPPWSTLIFRKLLENESFIEDFVIRFSDLLNTEFFPQKVVVKIDHFEKRIEDEIPRHAQKWNQFSAKSWEENVDLLRMFAQLRPAFVFSHLKDKFSLSDLIKISVKLSKVNSGKIKVNTIIPAAYPWEGNYYSDSELMLVALPNPGYIFTGWSGTVTSSSDTLYATPDQLGNIIANFSEHASFKNIVINEINYNSSSEFDTKDWIEIYNASEHVYDLSSWSFKDENDNNVFKIPENTIIYSNSYLIICRDSSSFINNWGSGFDLIGNFDFKLNNSGDLVRLFDNNLEIVDSVRFTDYSPWPSHADGTGNTLELKNPVLDNSVATNWKSSDNYGTPGLKNSVFVVSTEKDPLMIQDFSLFNNYPNPFNPSTLISYSIPHNSNVKIQIYDILGRKIKTLVNKEHSQGNYKILFEAENLPSGIYFYQLRTNGWSETKKMMLLK